MNAELVLKNGKVYTINENDEIYDSVAIKNGRIIKLGSNNDLDDIINEQTK